MRRAFVADGNPGTIRAPSPTSLINCCDVWELGAAGDLLTIRQAEQGHQEALPSLCWAQRGCRAHPSATAAGRSYGAAAAAAATAAAAVAATTATAAAANAAAAAAATAAAAAGAVTTASTTGPDVEICTKEQDPKEILRHEPGMGECSEEILRHEPGMGECSEKILRHEPGMGECSEEILR
ncbi:hypothetical protein CYMTET_32715, partial [Cymbomonas tetramitiformis]